MYSPQMINQMSRKAAEYAAQENFEPLIAFCDKDEAVFKCPDLGDYRPDGWKLIDTLFVDNSGFGSDNESALTIKQFVNKVKEGLGYAIIETGQFQVHIGVFRKDG